MNKSSASQPLFSTLKDDFKTIADDVQKRGVQRVVGGSFASIESFYLTEDDRKQLAKMGNFRRFTHRVMWLLKSLLMKLTPARRIMLALALWMLIIGAPRVQSRSFRLDFRMPWVGSVLLLTIVMLELKDKLVARDELEAGRQVQLALLPDQSPEIPGWDVWMYTQPANDVGGDLVDHLKISETSHAVALGDVAGKALPAALLSVKLQATIRALAPRFDQLADLGAAVNAILYRDGLPTRFASLIYLLLTPGSGFVRVLNAGHMPPLVVRSGTVTPMERGSMVLGIMGDAKFGEQSVELNPGEMIVCYSDGVTEAMDEQDDFFGDDRLLDLVRANSDKAVGTMGTAILDSIKQFVGGAVRSDDVSLVVLKRRQTA